MSTVPPWIQTCFPELTHVTPLNAGGQKSCFNAIHPNDGAVVLKVIHATEAAVSTEREIIAVQSVSSPRVPTIFAHGSIDSPLGPQRWIREQFIPGTGLRAVVQSGPSPFLEVVRMSRHVLEAVVSSEKVGIVHRDIKPDNILRDTSGNYWLIDFGIARHLTLASLTATASPWGKQTLGYAPPEQMRNSKPEIDARSDLFALGVTAVEMFTGTHPFRFPPANQFEVMRRVDQENVASSFGMDIAQVKFGELVSAMLQKRRDLRPRTAADALEWLDEVIASHSLLA